MLIYIIGVLALLILLCFILFFIKYTKLKDLQNSINICLEKIDSLLENKLSIVNNLLKDVKDERIKNSFSYDKDSSVIERESSLYDISFSINKYIKNGKNKKLKEEVRFLNNLEEDLDGLKDYYNTNVINYNSIFLKRYFNKLFRILKFNSYKSFKIRKLEEYEIFKD